MYVRQSWNFICVFFFLSFPGDTRTNDNSLVVSMEINGIVYQGVLFAQAAAAAAAATAALTPARGRLA
jgi:hypothetical protein